MILFIAEFITLACLVSIASPLQTTAVHQLPFQNNIGKPPATFRSPSGPPGTNRATYGPVPKSQQLFEIEYLEFAPSPFLSDQVVFVWIRGEVEPAYYPGAPRPPGAVTDAELRNATLKITLSAVYLDSQVAEPSTYTTPLAATAYNFFSHLSIRNGTGARVDYLSIGRPNDILLDMWIWADWLRAGFWTFAIEGELEDGRTLFALTLTQYLKGKLRVG